MTTEQEKAFIKELNDLSRKHGIYIGGCGCCGSPFLTEMKEPEKHEESGYSYEDNLEWISPDSFNWDQDKQTIIRGEK